MQIEQQRQRAITINNTLYISLNTTSKMAKDRTSEFHSTLASIRSRQAVPAGNGKSAGKAEARQPLLGGPSGASGSGSDGAHILRAPGAGGAGPKADGKKLSEFGKMAGGIAKDINATTAKLGKLAQCELRAVTMEVYY